MQRVLLFVLMAMTVLLVPGIRTEAGLLKCASRTSTQHDLRRLLSAAKAALTEDAPLEAPSICRNRGWAIAWLDTKHHQNAEGTEEWWTLQCRRDRRDWSCEMPHLQRSATLLLVIGGQERRVNLSFDANTSLSDARELTRRAWRNYENADAAPKPCESPANGKRDDKAWADTRTRYPLERAMTELSVTVTTEANVTEVTMFSGAGLAFRFRRGDSNDRSVLSECWSEWVIVT